MAEDITLKEDVNAIVEETNDNNKNVDGTVDGNSTGTTQPTKTEPDPIKKASKDFALQFYQSYTAPVVAESMMNKDKFKEVFGDEFVKKYGSKTKANEEMDKQYELVSKKYQEVAQQESQLKVLENLAYNIDDLEKVSVVQPGSELMSGSISFVPETVTGEQEIMGMWTPQTRSLREAAIDAKQVIDYKGDIINFKENPYDELAHEDAYTDDKGNKIKAFTYYMPGQSDTKHPRVNGLALMAVYEGQEVQGELVSRYDTANWFLKGNTLDTSTWKVAVGSIFDFVVDTADTLLSFGQWQAQLYSLGYAEKTSAYQGLKDWRTYLQSWETSKSDVDQADYVTFNNGVNLGINIAAQLLSGKAIASGMSSLLKVGVKGAQAISAEAKALSEAKTLLSRLSTVTSAEKEIAKKTVATLEKKVASMSSSFNRRQNIVKGTTLLFMGAMQAKETGDAAKAAGFSETESALIYFASLGSMALANKISDLGFEGLGLNMNKKIIKEAVQEGMDGITPATGGVIKAVSRTGKIAEKIKKGMYWTLNNKGIMAGTAREALEEETEFVLDEVVRHASTALSHLGYDTDDHPKFLTAGDKGYWDYFSTNTLMNMTGGALAGMGVSGLSKIRNIGKNTEADKELDWPQKGKTAEVFKYIAYHSTRNDRGVLLDKQLDQEIKRSRKKGWLGREDLSSKWDDKNQRFKRTNELTTDEINAGHSSQAEIQERAIRTQYEFYKHIYQNSSKSLEEIQKEDKDFGFLLNSKTAYEETRNLFDRKRELYSKAAGGGKVEFDARLKSLQISKDKIKVSKDGKVDDKAYREELTELSNTTKLTEKELEDLVEVNTAIEDMRTGAALEIMFLKHHLNSDKYRGKLDFEKLKGLIRGDKKAQEQFKEDLEIHMDHVKKNGELIESGIDADGNVSLGILNLVAGVPDGIILPTPVKEKLIKAVQGMGVSLDSQKQTIIGKMMVKLRDSIKEADDKTFADKSGEFKSKDIANMYVNALETALNEGMDKFVEFINAEDNFKLIDRDSIAAKKFAYILSKMVSVAAVTDASNFDLIKFDPDLIKIDPVTKEVPGDLAGMLYDITDFHPDDETKFDILLRDTAIDFKSDLASSITAMFSSNLSEKLQDILDPTFNTKPITGTNITRKQLLSYLDRSYELVKGTVRNDLMYGYTKAENGEIMSTGTDLKKRYEDLVGDAVDKAGNVTFFSDIKSAKDFVEQVETRLAEINFLLEFLPVLAKIDMLNKTKLGIEEGSDRALLTEYVDKYIIPIKDFVANPIEVLAELLRYQSELKGLLEKGNELITKAENASTDLNRIYSEQAVSRAQADLKKVYDVLDSAEFKSVASDPRFEETIKRIKRNIDNLESNFKDSSNASIKVIYDTIGSIKRSLYELYEGTKKNGESEFLQLCKEAVGKTNIDSGKYDMFFVYMMSNIDDLNTLIKETVTNLGNITDEELIKAKLPTSQQLVWIEMMVVAATNPDFLQTMRELGSRSNVTTDMFTSGAFFEAEQGTGKTAVVFKYASEIIDKVFKTDPKRDQITNTVSSGMIISSANETQTNNMRTVVGDKVKLPMPEIVTQYQLYELLVGGNYSIEELANDVLKNVHTIFYDEIGLVEYDGSKEDVELARKDPKRASTLAGILAVLEKINAVRGKNNHIILIGIGDGQQPGYINGEPSPRNPNGSETVNTNVEVQYVFSGRNAYKCGVSLTENFRSKVKYVTEDIKSSKQFFGIQNKPMSRFRYRKTDDGSHLGINIEATDFANLANNTDLINDIVKKLDADPDFTLAIAVGTDRNHHDETILSQQVNGKNTLLVDKILSNPKYKDQVKTYSIYSIQGSEASYVLACLPDDFFELKSSQVDNLSDQPQDVREIYRTRQAKFHMLLGRAHQYTHVAYNGSLITDKNAEGVSYIAATSDTTVVVTEAAESLEFKRNWLGLLNDALLPTSKVSPVDPNAQKLAAVNSDPRTIELQRATSDDIQSLIDLAMSSGEAQKPYDKDYHEVIGKFPALYAELDEAAAAMYLAIKVGGDAKRQEAEEKFNKITDELKKIVSDRETQKSVQKVKPVSIDDPSDDEIQRIRDLGLEAVDGSTNDTDTPFVSDELINRDIEQRLRDLADKYGVTLDNYSIEEINNKLRPKLTKDDLYKLDHIREEALGDTSSIEITDILEEHISENESKIESEDELDVVGVPVRKETDIDIMTELEKDGFITAFQDIQSQGKNPKENRVTFCKNVYGANAVSNAGEAEGIVWMAIHTDKDGKVVVDHDKFDFFLVTYVDNGPKTGTISNNAIVAKRKGSNDGVVFIAQLPKTESLNTTTGSLGSFLSNRIAALKENGPGPNNPNIKTYGNDVKYIESKISKTVMDQLVVGMTVGNLVTSDEFVSAVTRSMSGFENLQIGKISKGRVRNRSFVNDLIAFKAIGGRTAWDSERFKGFENTGLSPFISFNNSNQIIRKLGNKYYTIVKTSIGNIPFVIDGYENAYPVVGIHNGKLVYSQQLIDAKAKSVFIKELQEIANVLKGLIPNDADYSSIVQEVTDEEAKKEIESVLDITIESANVDPNNSESLVSKKLTDAFLNKKSETFLGNKKISLKEAKKLWKTTGEPKNTSDVYVITRGALAGRAIMFYTFNDDLDLSKLSYDEMLALYNKVNDERTKRKTRLTTNRLGIGMMLLDVKGYKFSELREKYPNVTTQTVTKVDINKAVMSKDAERRVIALFAHLHSLLNPNDDSTRNIVEQLKANMPDYNKDLAEQLTNWMDAVREDSPEYITLIKSLLDGIFTTENLGRVPLTYKIDAKVRQAMFEFNMIPDNLDDDPVKNAEKKVERQRQIFELYKDSLIPIGIANSGTLAQVMLVGAESHDNSGFVYVNKDGKIAIKTSDDTVISAVDNNLVKMLKGKHAAAATPDASFNVYNLLKILEKVTKESAKLLNDTGLSADEVINTALGHMDKLLDMIGLQQGMFISPSIASTSSPIVALKASGVEAEFITDVKRFRKPQIVMNWNRLVDGSIVDEEEDYRTEEEKQLELQQGNKMSVALRVNGTTHPVDLKNLLEEVSKLKNKGLLSQSDAEELSALIQNKFNSLDTLPEDLTNIDFTKHIFVTSDTEEYVKSLNSLAKLAITRDLLDIIFNPILENNTILSTDQLSKLKSIKDAMRKSLPASDGDVNLKEVFDMTKAMFRDKTLNGFAIKITDPKTLYKIESIMHMLSKSDLSFPIYTEMSPKDRVLLLMAMSATDADGNKLISDADLANTSITDIFTNNPETKKSKDASSAWTTNSLSLGKNNRSANREMVDQIKIDKKDFIYHRPVDIRTAFEELIAEGNYNEFVELLNKFEEEMFNIYYNSETKDLMNKLLAELHLAAKSIADPTAWTLNHQSLTNYIIEQKQEMEIAKNKKMLNNLLSSTIVSEMKEQDFKAWELLTNFVGNLDDNSVGILTKVINNEYTKEEMAAQQHVTNVSTITNMLIDFAGENYIDSLERISYAIADLSVDEDFKCFV